MSKLSYWERRQIENMYRYMQSAEETADQIAKLYSKASRWLSLEMVMIFERYMTKHGLSEKEARKLLNELKDRTSIEEMLQRIKLSDTKGERKELITKLESVPYRARIVRLEQLQEQLDRVMQEVYDQEKKISTSFYADLVDESYYRTIFDLQQRTQAAFSFGYIDQKQIDDVVHSKWSGKNYSNRIWDNTRALAQDIKEELLINLVTGRTEREAAEIIENKFAKGASEARRLVRTESAYLSSELSAKAIEEAGVEEYQFMATLDLKTSEICRKKDLQIFKVSERKVGVNCPPMHPWCRSTIVAVIDRKYLEGKKRAAIDPETGKRIMVPRDMTYEQWYEKYVKGNAKAERTEKKIKNKPTDQKQFKRYKAVLGDDVPDKLDEFQEMKYNDGENFKKLKKKADTYSEINKKEWSDEFKQKSKEAYDRFSKEDVYLSTHALSRLPRLNKPGYVPVSEEDVFKSIKRKSNYSEGADKSIWFNQEKQLAIVKNKSSGDIVSIVRRKHRKEAWDDVSI